jgi:hyperosmotically inducible protein
LVAVKGATHPQTLPRRAGVRESDLFRTGIQILVVRGMLSRERRSASAWPDLEDTMLRRVAVLAALLTASTLTTLACSQSDPGITTAVKSRFAADDTVKAYQIDVDTNAKVVTLSGTVETSAQKEHAVMLARQTEGVRDVVDRISVNAAAVPTTGDLREDVDEAAREAREETREATESAKETARDAQRRAGEAADRTGAAVTDAAVTSAVKTKFLADTTVSGLKIDVDTSNGVVTLNGTVASKTEADRAVTLARETDGVTRVVDNLRIGR